MLYTFLGNFETFFLRSLGRNMHIVNVIYDGKFQTAYVTAQSHVTHNDSKLCLI